MCPSTAEDNAEKCSITSSSPVVREAHWAGMIMHWQTDRLSIALLRIISWDWVSSDIEVRFTQKQMTALFFLLRVFLVIPKCLKEANVFRALAKQTSSQKGKQLFCYLKSAFWWTQWEPNLKIWRKKTSMNYNNKVKLKAYHSYMGCILPEYFVPQFWTKIILWLVMTE